MDDNKNAFKRAGFAVLRGSTWSYLLKNIHVIIGRKPTSESSKWLVDIDLGDSRHVARQHALLVYNFRSQCFEIRCLTKKGRIKVNGRSYRFQDGAVPLSHRSVVTIHNCSFVFLLPS